MGLVEAIFFRQIGGSKDTFLQSHLSHISDDDIAKIDESFLLSFLMLRFSFLYSQAQYVEPNGIRNFEHKVINCKIFNKN